MSPDVVPQIPDGDISLSFVRAAGPGGQNVNKVASAVQLRFDLAGTQALNPATKQRLAQLAGRRLTLEGAVVIIARNHRTQDANRREALQRLEDLVARASVVPKPRKATRPTFAARERRIEHKTQRKQTKRLRSRVRRDED